MKKSGNLISVVQFSIIIVIPDIPEPYRKRMETILE